MPDLQSTQFTTASQRIAAIAWRWNEQFPPHLAFRAKYEMAASDREIDAGFALGQAMAAEYRRLRARYGDPAYGSWPEEAERAQIVKTSVLACMRGNAEFLSEAPLPKIAPIGAKRPKLTREQRKAVKSLIEDGGYTRSEAVALVLAGFGELEAA